MTIAISVKVNDGVVLAADSASTIITDNNAVVNVYNNANKVFNLRKGLPIGATTWGLGSIGQASISTLMKDLRRRFSGEDPSHHDWHLDAENYTVEAVANRVREFMYEEQYVPLFDSQSPDPRLGMGFLVAGYSAGETIADEFEIHMDTGGSAAPVRVRAQTDVGIAWHGQPEAVSRVVLGFGTALPSVLVDRLGVPEEQTAAVIDVLRESLGANLVVPAMPIQDAIDLAEFLVGLSISYSRFMPGASTVGGPIEVAAITKHEGFKWIRRKYYYDRRLNPGEERRDAADR